MVALAEIDKFKTLAESLRFGAASTVAVRADGAGVVRHLLASAVCSGEQGGATFTGYVADNETGLCYARARMYSAELGRFVSRDPLGYVDGSNLYRGYFVPGRMDPTGLAEVWEDYINCIGHAAGENGSIQPGNSSLQDTMQGLGWSCTDSKSRDCKPECGKERAMMVYVYIKPAAGWKNTSDAEKQFYLDLIRYKFRDKDVWGMEGYWGQGGELDFHGIRRNCLESLDSKKAWDYVSRHRQKMLDGTYEINGYLNDADDYWKGAGEKHVLVSKCCKKPK